MTPTQAAEIIGCHATLIRHNIRAGKIKARKVPMPGGGYAWDITDREVLRFLAIPLPTQHGKPRGTKRG